MKHTLKLNGFTLYFFNSFWKNIFYWSLGLNNLFFKFYLKRVYRLKNIFILKESNDLIKDILYFNLFFSCMEFYLFRRLQFKNLVLSYLLITDICCCYKTYRHIFGLPVNGQRTWSNANTTYYNNLLLRQHKLKKFHYYVNDTKPLSLKKVFLCEYINLFWKKNFFLEWVSVRRRRKLVEQKNFFSKINIDFNFLVNSNIEHYYSRSIFFKKKKSHRKKRKFSKNSFNIGWNFGFSRKYLNSIRHNFSLKKKSNF